MKKSIKKITPFEIRKYFAEYIEKSIGLAENNPEFDFSKNNYHLHSENTKFALAIFKFQMKLYELISDLKKVEVFMRRFPNRTFYEENNIDQLDHIKYHYEVFIHKIHTILEVKKLAINTLYSIGLKEENCTWDNLKNQKEIKNSRIYRIIEGYFKTFRHIIEHRHLNTHRAHYIDIGNDELKADYFIYQGAKRFGSEVSVRFQKYMPESILKFRIKEYRKDKISHIKNGTEVAEKYFEEFETAMLVEFFRKVK